MMTKDNINEKVKRIEELIESSSLDDAFTELKDFAKESGDREFRKAVIIIQQSYNDLKKEKNFGTINNPEKNTNTNQISERLLNTLYEIEEVTLKKSQRTRKNKT